MRLAHQRLQLAAHSRGLLVPLVATVFLLAGAFFPGPTDSRDAWAFSATAIAALAAWFVVVIDRAVPPQADAMLVARAGGDRARRLARAVTIVELAMGLTALFLLVPLVAGVLGPAPSATDLGAAALGMLTSGVFGGALGSTLARPVRPGTAFAIVVLAYVAQAIVVPAAPAVAGPVGVGSQLATSDPGTIPAGLVAALLLTLVSAAALLFLARRLGRFRG